MTTMTKTMTAMERDIRNAQAEAGDGQDWEYCHATVMQRLLDNGTVWALEGSAGRAAMDAITSGACFLPEQSFRDYWGNVIPSRNVLRPGSKGTLENSARFYSV